ncbi:hypothetical protein [Pseudomonas veronii]
MQKIISRKEAKAKGLKHYFTGKECPNGHFAERRVSSYCCITCSGEWATNERATNRDYLEKQRKICRENNLRRYHSDSDYKKKVNREAYLSWKKRYATPEGRAKCDAWSKDWRSNNPEKVKQMGESWRKNNPEKMAISYAIRASIKRLKKIKNDDFKVVALGYSRDEFKSHMESLFKDGMSWENYGEWQIDHVRPVASFMREGNFETLEIHALSNLQPLWKEENMTKGSKESPP